MEKKVFSNKYALKTWFIFMWLIYTMAIKSKMHVLFPSRDIFFITAVAGSRILAE
jgi:hypothetical protein